MLCPITAVVACDGAVMCRLRSRLVSLLLAIPEPPSAFEAHSIFWDKLGEPMAYLV